MSVFLGIDLGTSSVKAMLCDLRGTVKGFAKRDFDIDIPMPCYAEQSPEMWWRLTVEAVREALSGMDAGLVAGVGLSGQMHGMVAVNASGVPVYPAIIWCDQRSTREVADIQAALGDALGACTLNPLATGFQLASLLWLKRHQPLAYDQTAYVLSPKDYIRYRLTGAFGTDYSDASAALMFDTAHMRRADDLLTAVGLRPSLLPAAHGSHEMAGAVTDGASRETALRAGTPVVYGGGDQTMQAVGNGIVAPGLMSLTIGTGGQLLMCAREPLYDQSLRMHTFCGAVPGTWNLMGAILSAGMSMKWLKEKVLHAASYDGLNRLAQQLPAGSEGLFFFPYLVGERTPYMNPRAKGAFWGLTLAHTDTHMVRAVMEGVAYAMRDCLTLFEKMGATPSSIMLAGGGGTSALWAQILSDVLEKEITVSETDEQACLGAAMTAAVGTGAFASYEQACQSAIRRRLTPVTPRAENTAVYRRGYALYRAWYEANQPLFDIAAEAMEV